MTIGQLWGAGAACATFVAAVFGLGVFVQSNIGASLLLAKDREIVAISTQVRDLTRTVDELTGRLKRAFEEIDSLGVKSEFLNRVASYLQGRDEVSKKLLIDVVCSMWKESEKRTIQLARSPIELTAADLRSGLSPDVIAILATQGISPELLERLRTDNFPDSLQSVGPIRVLRPDGVSREQERAVASVKKQIQEVQVIKIINFADGTRYRCRRKSPSLFTSRQNALHNTVDSGQHRSATCTSASLTANKSRQASRFCSGWRNR
jgi:hypothetical protein